MFVVRSWLFKLAVSSIRFSLVLSLSDWVEKLDDDEVDDADAEADEFEAKKLFVSTLLAELAGDLEDMDELVK